MVEMSQSCKTELCEEPAEGSAETLGALGWWLGSVWRDRNIGWGSAFINVDKGLITEALVGAYYKCVGEGYTWEHA